MNEVAKVINFRKADEYGVVDGMLKLCQYGKPRLSSQANGEWYCAIDMFVAGDGIDFKVASDFKHKSMEEAVRCCISRLVKALTDLGV